MTDVYVLGPLRIYEDSVAKSINMNINDWIEFMKMINRFNKMVEYNYFFC